MAHFFSLTSCGFSDSETKYEWASFDSSLEVLSEVKMEAASLDLESSGASL